MSRTTEHGVTFDFNGPLSPWEVTNLNAAIRPTGVKVEKYWRTGVISVSAQGKRIPAVGHVIIGSAGGPTPTVSTHVTPPTGTVSQPRTVIVEPDLDVIEAALVATDQADGAVVFVTEDDVPDEYVTEDEARQGHKYVPMPRLTALFSAIVRGVKNGRLPRAMWFFGPSGSGKTDGAQYLAGLAGLPFLKVDAASMPDAESWFGTREVTVQDGVSVTTYVPSAFVLAIQKPGLTLIDEANRVRDETRQVLIPLTDGTRRVMNPLTGQVIQMHPEHYLILSGNRGLAFTGTYAVDPAMLNRAYVLNFDYLAFDDEVAVAMEATGCEERAARLFVRYATDVRAQVRAQEALGGTDLSPVSTRQVIGACELVADGLDVDEAANVTVINLASMDGGDQSVVTNLRTIWTGIRPLYDSGEVIGEVSAAPQA